MKQKAGILFLICMFCLAGTGCSSDKQQEYKGDYIFCLDANETKVAYEKYTIKAKEKRLQVAELLKKMQQEPSDISLKKAFPDDVQADDYIMDASGQLTLYLNANYGNLEGVSEILRRAAIVKTLCQVKGVESVQFYVAGQPLTDQYKNAVGYMTADSFIDNTGGETTYKQKATLNMYFSDRSGEKLVVVPVDITYDATIPLEQLAIEQLIQGPYQIDGVDAGQVLPTMPEGTHLNKVTVKENTCYVDFSSAFLKKRKNVSAEVTLYSVVNTLVELANVNKVQFSINGEQVLMYNDAIDFGTVFERNLDIIEPEEEK